MSEPPPALTAGKPAWRRWLRTRHEQNPRRAAECLRNEISAYLAGAAPMVIASFAALPDEPDLWPLLGRHPAHRWLFPRINGENLEFCQIRSAEDLTPGAYGLREPSPTLPAISPEKIRLVLCPGLGFGRDLTRLGRGKGYYDRFLPRLVPGTPCLGIAFPCRHLPSVPAGPHDCRMTALVGA